MVNLLEVFLHCLDLQKWAVLNCLGSMEQVTAEAGTCCVSVIKLQRWKLKGKWKEVMLDFSKRYCSSVLNLQLVIVCQICKAEHRRNHVPDGLISLAAMLWLVLFHALDLHQLFIKCILCKSLVITSQGQLATLGCTIQTSNVADLN